MGLQGKLAEDFAPHSTDSRGADTGYKNLWQFAVILTIAIALIPLAIMTVVNYHQDQEIYRSESRFAVSQIVSNTKRSLEFVIEERLSALSLIVNEKDFDALNDERELNSILSNLKNSFGGFVDLGLIDRNGIQLVYVGPYNLEGKDYSEQSWFHQVKLRGEYVSDVFMGYRNFPHFVIAVKHDDDKGNFHVLRATLDTELLIKQVSFSYLDSNTDAFVINRQGVLQTPSNFYGKVLQDTYQKVPANTGNREIVEPLIENGKRITRGYTYIEKTSFILIAMQKREGQLRHWIVNRSVLLWFLLISVVLIIIASIYISTRLINRVRESDVRRAKLFHNMEYTNKMATIGRMAASVAHEINNPLAIINEKAGLLKDMAIYTADFPHKEKTLSVVESIHKSVERCSQVTHRLLGFAKRMDFRKELIDMEKLLQEVVGFLSREASHRNVLLNFDFPQDLPPIESDRGQLQQVFLNILNNAIAAVDDGGRIDIEAAAVRGKAVNIAITDNGKGISADNLKHIFEPFFSTKGEFGTGLGLSITRDIINKLGGEIYVESDFGEGTRFIISFPLNQKISVE